jgi:hypothetical protein
MSNSSNSGTKIYKLRSFGLPHYTQGSVLLTVVFYHLLRIKIMHQQSHIKTFTGLVARWANNQTASQKLS